MESLEELLNAILDWTFLPLGLAVVILSAVGSGLWSTRWSRTVWALGLVLMGLTLYFGISRHEWGEVLFNGQLL